MATWQDGPEYAPLVRPTDFEAPDQPPDGAVEEAPGADEDSAQELSARAPQVRPSFTAPESAPLEDLSSDSPDRRDPREPFAVVARTASSGSAWPAAHAAAEPVAYEPAAYEPGWDGSAQGSAPYAPPTPPRPTPPYPPPAPFRSAPPPWPAPQWPVPDPSLPLSPYAPAPYAPVPYTPPPDGSDLDARERSALWLLLPGALYLLGAWTGPLMTVAMLLASLLLTGRPGIRAAARTLSRIVLVGLSVVTLLLMLNGDGFGSATAIARGVGLVYVFLCAMWFVRERSEVDAERHRRSQQSTTWPPPQDRG